MLDGDSTEGQGDHGEGGGGISEEQPHEKGSSSGMITRGGNDSGSVGNVTISIAGSGSNVAAGEQESLMDEDDDTKTATELGDDDDDVGDDDDDDSGGEIEVKVEVGEGDEKEEEGTVLETSEDENSAVEVEEDDDEGEREQLQEEGIEEGTIAQESISLIRRIPFIPLAHNGKFITRWNVMIDVVQVGYLYMLPMALAFVEDFTILPMLVVFYLMDFLSAVDVGLEFVTKYVDEYGQTIDDYGLIYKRYLKSWMIPDCISVIPFDIILLAMGDKQSWAFIRLLKLIRCHQLVHHFFTYEIPYLNHGMSRLFKNMIVFVVGGHLNGCLFWTVSKQWADSSWIVLMGYDTMSFANQYLATYYWGIQAIVFSFREKVNEPAEKLFSSIELLWGAIIYGSIFGNIASLIRSFDASAAMNEAAEQHNYKVSYTKQYMHKSGFPVELQKRIKDHQEIQWLLHQGMDESNIFTELPMLLRQDVAMFMYGELIQSVPLFEGTDFSFQKDVALALKPLTALKGWYIFRAGDDAQEMYFIRSGKVDVVSADGETVFVTLQAGKFFGEIALIDGGKRSAGVRANVTCSLCVLTKADFDAILSGYPVIKEKIRKTVEERREADRKRNEEKAKEEALKKAEEERLEMERLAREEAMRKKSDEHNISRVSKMFTAFRGSSSVRPSVVPNPDSKRVSKDSGKGSRSDVSQRGSRASARKSSLKNIVDKLKKLSHPSLYKSDDQMHNRGSGFSHSSHPRESGPSSALSSERPSLSAGLQMEIQRISSHTSVPQTLAPDPIGKGSTHRKKKLSMIQGE
eukprot:Nk52_evm2s402 gene=Nk52_evmTU2s402